MNQRRCFSPTMAYCVFWTLFMAARPVPAEQPIQAPPPRGAEEEHFLYGSIGTEGRGTPYWIWRVLPAMFPEKLPRPGGYESFGFLWEKDRETPIGFHRETIAEIPVVGINCSLCHVASVRTSPDAKPLFLVGAPAHQLDFQAYQQFLFACAIDPRFNPENTLQAIAAVHQLTPAETEAYRTTLIPRVKNTLTQARQVFSWQYTRPVAGPGRIDPFNPVKFRVFFLPEDYTIGNADMPSVWNQRVRAGLWLHWDGFLQTFKEIMITSAIGDGASPEALDLASFQRIEDFLMDLKPPKYAFPIDAELAERGKSIYGRYCADCHEIGGKKTGQVIPLAEIQTDHHRLDETTFGEIESWRALAKTSHFELPSMRKTNGYAAVPLDGLWVRAPYLHNGSVPSLADMLVPPVKRPASFYRGYDVYDSERVGFLSAGPEAERAGSRFDTRSPGNAKEGHHYGTELPDDHKRALLEFLKTL